VTAGKKAQRNARRGVSRFDWRSEKRLGRARKTKKFSGHPKGNRPYGFGKVYP